MITGMLIDILSHCHQLAVTKQIDEILWKIENQNTARYYWKTFYDPANQNRRILRRQNERILQLRPTVEIKRSIRLKGLYIYRYHILNLMDY